MSSLNFMLKLPIISCRFSSLYKKNLLRTINQSNELQLIMCAKRRLSTELVKSITVKTCVGVYDELRQINPAYYKDAPLEGLELTVNYADTWKEDKQFDKVVVAVHGVPGHYTHFDRLVEFYRHTSVRVIAPNLPDFSHTRQTKYFWHSTKEKVSFLKDFLAQLNIQTVDCLVSHSLGVQTIAGLWENPGDIKINSVALCSPQPLWDFNETHKQQMERILRFKSEFWYNFLSFSRIYKLPIMPMRLENINEFLMLGSVVLDDNTSKDIVKRFELLVNSNIPVVLLFGSAESLISKKAIKRLNESLGIKEDEIIYIDPEIDSVDSLNMNNRINSYVIKTGGHFVHANHYKFSNKMVDNLINYNRG